MLDANDLLNTMKKAAQEAVEAGQPSDFCFGKVTSESPLKILVEQRMTLSEAQLVLTRNVTNFSVTVTISEESPWYTQTNRNESSGPENSSVTPHNHSIIGTKTLTIHHALKLGEKVILLKQKGGQKYLVLDRVVSS